MAPCRSQLRTRGGTAPAANVNDRANLNLRRYHRRSFEDHHGLRRATNYVAANSLAPPRAPQILPSDPYDLTATQQVHAAQS